MAGPPTPTTGQITWIFSGSALPAGGAVTTCGFFFSDAPSGPALLAEALWDDLRPAIVNGVTLDAIEIKQGPVATGPTTVYAVGTSGTTGPDGVPPNTALLVRKTVLDVSGRFAGRMFWPGLPESEVDSAGNIDPTFLAGLQGTFNDFFATMGSQGYGLRIFSEGSSDTREVSELNVQARVATQRRRMRR